MIAHPSKPLLPAEADSFGRELEAVRGRVLADLGQRDVDHIRGVIRMVRYGEVAGRALLHVGVDPLTFTLGVAALSVSKILENMEVGHNVMHGQYDWTEIRSSTRSAMSGTSSQTGTTGGGPTTSGTTCSPTFSAAIATSATGSSA